MPERPIHAVFRHPLSLFGMWLSAVSAMLFLIFFFADLLGEFSNPYFGILFFLILPGVFVLGLVLMPAGVYLRRRRERLGKPATEWPRIDLNDSRQRTIAFFVLIGTAINVVVLSLAAYRGIEYMDSVSFCGQVCHSVMAPEYTAYRNGSHARVACVSCHIGPGAPWFVKSKLSGTRQVFAVTFNTYPRPIPSPVENLRPARETCEECHWPEKFTGDKIVTFHEFADDEANTETTTTMRVHVGGGSEKYGIASGIHWHMDPGTRIEYITTDPKRQTIAYVKVVDRRGERAYRAPEVTDAELAKGERRTMDCMDCHNRPAHPFTATAEEGIDSMLGLGRIPRALPFIRQQAVAALKQKYPSQDAAAESIARTIRQFYRTQYAAQYASFEKDVNRAVEITQDLYRRNVFPQMNVSWGTYFNNIGHQDFPGCFRCHDENHAAKDGKTISQDCELCHQMLEAGK
ncbi:MAG: cytochrome c3 family protein [Bacteroidales bacterium]